MGLRVRHKGLIKPLNALLPSSFVVRASRAFYPRQDQKNAAKKVNECCNIPLTSWQIEIFWNMAFRRIVLLEANPTD